MAETQTVSQLIKEIKALAVKVKGKAGNTRKLMANMKAAQAQAATQLAERASQMESQVQLLAECNNRFIEQGGAETKRAAEAGSKIQAFTEQIQDLQTKLKNTESASAGQLAAARQELLKLREELLDLDQEVGASEDVAEQKATRPVKAVKQCAAQQPDKALTGWEAGMKVQAIRGSVYTNAIIKCASTKDGKDWNVQLVKINGELGNLFWNVSVDDMRVPQ